MTASVLGSVRARTTQLARPIVRHTGMRNRPSCSRALASAVALWPQTASTRWSISGETRASWIRSKMIAPTGAGRMRDLPAARCC